MPPFVYYIAGGYTFFPGTTIVVLAVICRASSSHRIAAISSTVLMLLGLAAVLFSAEAVPFWVDAIWLIAILTWFLRSLHKNAKLRIATDAFALAATMLLVSLAIPYQFSPTLTPAKDPCLYVIGDSISAGISNNTPTWPTILAAQCHLEIIDLSRAGSTIVDASHHLQSQPLTDGMVLLEIGGNDIIGHTPLPKFAADLNTLAQQVCGPNRQVIMLELPLFPLDNAYGIEQRTIASRYGIHLIPRRHFAKLLATPGATVDGIHLSSSGQQLMAQMIWNIVGPSFDQLHR